MKKSDFYHGIVPAGSKLQQGDLVANMVFAKAIDPSAMVLLKDPKPKNALESPLPDFPAEIVFKSCFGLIVTQTCDLQVREKNGEKLMPDSFTFALVVSACDYNKKLVGDKYQNEVKMYQKVSERAGEFYLPAHGKFELARSVALFKRLQTISPVPGNQSLYDNIVNSPRLRLSSDALGILQMRLGYFFSRFAVDEAVLEMNDS